MRWSVFSANGLHTDVVSLGLACQPAHQIRRITGVTSAYPFDWVVTTDDGLVAHIKDDLQGFFARDRLTQNDEGYIVDARTDTRFIHEFPRGCDFDRQYREHEGRLGALAERWRALLDSDKQVLFVRQHAWNPDRRATACRLRDALAARAPRLRFNLLYLTRNPADEEPWGEPGIVNRHLAQPVPYEWTGDDRAWDRVLGAASMVSTADGGR